MKTSLICFFLTLVQFNLTLEGEFRLMTGLDPSNSLNEASEGERQSSMAETHQLPPSPLSLFPTSASSQLEKSGISTSPHSPQIAPPESPSRLSLGLSDDYKLRGKRLSSEKSGSQGEEGSDDCEPFQKRLKISLDLPLSSFGQRELGISASPPEHTSEKQKDDEVPNKLKEVDRLMETQGEELLGGDKDGRSVEGLIESSPTIIETSVKEYNPGGVNRAFWAWVWVIWEHYGQSATSEVQEYLDIHMEDLKASCFPENQSSPDLKMKQTGEGSGRDWQQNQISLFTSLLWAVNIRVLEILGVQKPSLVQGVNRFKNSSECYFQEQRDLISWFVEFMKLFNNPEVIKSVDGKETRGSLIVKMGKPIYQKVMKAVHSIPGPDCYQTYLPEYSKDYIFTSEGELLNSEAVVYLIGFYYKNKNFQKWNYAFRGQDRDLLAKLEDLGVEWFFPPELSLMPWKEPCNRKLPLNGPNNLIVSRKNFMNFIQPIPCSMPTFDLLKIGDNERFFISSGICDFDDVPGLEKKLKAILNSDALGTIKLMPELQPDSRAVRPTQSYLPIFWSVFSKRQGPIVPPKFEYDDIRRRLQPLFILIWQINGKILQYMGADIYKEPFLKEQKMIQRYFEFLMSPSQAHDFNSKSLNGQCDSEEIFKEQVRFHVTGSILFEDIDQLSNASRVVENSGVRNLGIQQKLRLCKSVAVVIGTYYKNVNFQKWEEFFISDSFFLVLIQNLSTRENWNEYAKNVFPLNESRELLPWKDPIKTSASSS